MRNAHIHTLYQVQITKGEIGWKTKPGTNNEIKPKVLRWQVGEDLLFPVLCIKAYQTLLQKTVLPTLPSLTDIEASKSIHLKQALL